MLPITLSAFEEELEKLAVARVKSNDRMPARSKAHLDRFVKDVESLPAASRAKALVVMKRLEPKGLFELMHSMRRWYSGGTMARKILEHRPTLKTVMKIDPKDAVGSYRGFKVSKDNPLASSRVGQKLELEVTRNHGFSSWTTTEAPAHKFSGGGGGKVGLVIKLVDSKGITPVLAPPDKTKPWFNALYEKTIGTSFRPKEGEYLIYAPKVRAEVVRVKR